MELTTKLNEEIGNGFEELAELEISSQEYSNAVDSVTKLMDRAIEIEKIEKQSKEDHRSRVAKNVIDVGIPLLSLGVSTWMALTSLKFEENGSITTTIGRKTLDWILKKK